MARAQKRGAQGRSARKSSARKNSPRKSIARKSTPLDRLRAICLALPEAHEQIAWGEPTFRVKNKLFSMHASPNNHHGGGREAVWCKAKHIAQDDLVRADPGRFFVPPYVGVSGWVGIWIDRGPDWKVVADLLRDAYRLTAPKRLAAQLDEHSKPL